MIMIYGVMMHMMYVVSLDLRTAPPDQQSPLISRNQSFSHPQNIINPTMMRPLVSPKGLVTFPHIHHAQLSIIGPIAGHILIHHTQCLGLLAERTGSDCSVGTRVCEGDTGGICQREEVFTHAFDTVYVTSLQTFRNYFFGGQIVSDQPVVTTSDQFHPFLQEIYPHDLSPLAEDCLLLEEQRNNIISDQILTDLEEFYLEISPQSDHSESSGGSPISQQIEDIPLVQFLGHLEGMLWSEGTLCGIPETDTALKIANEEVLVDDGEAICPFGKDGVHDLKFLIEAIDLYFALGGLSSLALQEVTTADKLFLIEDGYSFDLHRRVLTGEMEVCCQLPRVEWCGFDCLWLQGGLEIDLTSLFLLTEARDLIPCSFVQPHDSILDLSQLTLVGLQQFLHHPLASCCLELLGPALGRIDEGSVLGHILYDVFEVFPCGYLERISGVGNCDGLVDHFCCF